MLKYLQCKTAQPGINHQEIIKHYELFEDKNPTHNTQ